MMRNNNDIDTVVKTVTMSLALVSLVLAFVGLIDLGQTKTFWFVVGEIAVATAIGYSFQTARGVNKGAPFGIATLS